MKRRDFLKIAATVPAINFIPTLAAANGSPERIVVLVKLAGGNDGLNMVVPYQDPKYYQLRPTVAVPRHLALPLERDMALNPYMKALIPFWKTGEVAFIQGIGYQNTDLSHFRSLDIWETASSINEYKTEGWLNAVLPRFKQGLHGVILDENAGPFCGKDCNAIAMQSPEVFLSQVSLVQDIRPINHNPAISHLTQVQHQLYSAGEQLRTKMSRPKGLNVPFSTSTFGRRLESVAKMIVNGVDAAAYKVELDGFDTHVNQVDTQSNLLQHLSVGLASFANAMKQAGKWDNVILVTYSEFGRRVQENHGRGTDHGSASTHLVMGGRVRGGLYGDNPNLNELDHNMNLPSEVDFKKLYGTITQNWWRQTNPWASLGVLPIIG
ncbi:MAG: hypothetical protein RLZZ422_1374 [Pseudomonadota bacterium]|jgi:uncharacterized protein (DUF1501 family)